jgi:2-dehydro-3-deoxyphosphogluconate aldolase/(4S)-4-hydroxy-2-oxoglutarate aldolase
MDRSSILQRILECGIVAVVRSPEGAILVDVAQALVEGGINVIEITFTVPAAHRVLEAVQTSLGSQVLLGAGTVLDSETARVALLSGADFIVGPTLSLPVIALCHRYGKVVIPGAYTPTEILTAWEAGADIVKVFPADIGGPSYFRAIRAPLPQVRLMPTGGVNLQTAADFLRAGACALGIGASLVEPRAIAERDFGRITSLAKEYVRIVRETRAQLAEQSKG